MRTRFTVSLVLGIVLAAIMLWSFATHTDAKPGRHHLLALVVALAFVAALVIVAWLEHVDGFSFGSVVIAVLLEWTIFTGWNSSPQEEADGYFLFASALPLVLVVVTLLFNALQKEA